MKPATPRLPQFEALRLLAMFFIVALHTSTHGMDLFNHPPVFHLSDGVECANYFLLQAWVNICSVGVNVYVLITGYFLIRSSRFQWEKMGKVWLQTFLFSVAIPACLILTDAVGTEEWKMGYLLPLWSDVYWFVTRYVALLALAPFLSRLAAQLTRRDYLILLAVLAVLNFKFFGVPYGEIFSGNKSLFWFISLFFFGGYLRQHAPAPHRYVGWAFLGYCILLTLCLALFQWRGGKEEVQLMTGAYNGFHFFSAVMLFRWAQRWNLSDGFWSRTICRLSPFAFGVYLLHDHPLVRQLLWHCVLDLPARLGSAWLLPLCLASTLSIFIVSLFLSSFVRVDVCRKRRS